jgi:pimeloyl-ACP methyl ester carboxylesterase
MNRANTIRTADGTELFYRDWGIGTPVVFLAGWALPSDFWSYQMAPMSEAGFRCIAYDRRGHGRSSDPGRNFDYDTLANDLETVLDALNLGDVQVVAHSMSAGSRALSLAAAVGAHSAHSADRPDAALPGEDRRQPRGY